jgi:hypothetical protein
VKIKKLSPTKIVAQTNTIYVKKSPGWENLGDAVSSLLPYVYTVFQSVSYCRRWFKGLLTEVCIEEDAEIRPSYEKGCEDAPYLWRKLQKSWEVEYNIVSREYFCVN